MHFKRKQKKNRKSKGGIVFEKKIWSYLFNRLYFYEKKASKKNGEKISTFIGRSFEFLPIKQSERILVPRTHMCITIVFIWILQLEIVFDY